MTDCILWEGRYADTPASVVMVGSRVVPRLAGQYAANPQDREGIFIAAVKGLSAAAKYEDLKPEELFAKFEKAFASLGCRIVRDHGMHWGMVAVVLPNLIDELSKPKGG